MPNIFSIPQINPLKIYYQSDILNTAAFSDVALKSFDPNQNERGIDNDFLERRLKSWMDVERYFQPYQQGDKITLQWLGIDDAPPVATYTITLLDQYGQTIKQQDADLGAEVGTGSGIFIRECEMLLYDVPEGKYFVQIRKVGLLGAYNFFAITEGIDVKAYHPNTMLYRYKHTENAYSVYWETGIEMWIRIHSAFTELNPGSKFNVYEDQPLNLTLLSGTKYREYQLSFGVDTNPIPDWLIDKIEAILLCDTVYIDHIQYTRTEGSKLEINRTDKNPLATANITVRETNNDIDLVIDNFEPIVICDAPTAEWFYLAKIEQNTPATSYSIQRDFNGAVSLVNWLNSSNFLGVVDYVNTYYAIDANNRIVLITNVQTVYNDYSPGLTISTGDVYTGWIHTDIRTTTTETDFRVSFTNTVITTKYAYFWGDGNKATGSGTSNSTTKVYTGNKRYTARLYWNQVHNLSLDGDQVIYSIKGSLPVKTKTFSVENNQLRSVVNNIFTGLDGAATAIQFNDNKLNQFAQDEIIRAAYDCIGQGNFSGTVGIDLQGQTPVIGPSDDPVLWLMLSKLSQNFITISHD